MRRPQSVGRVTGTDSRAFSFMTNRLWESGTLNTSNHMDKSDRLKKECFGWLKNPDFWIAVAIILVLLGLASIFLCFKMPTEDKFYKYCETIIIPLFAAGAFCVGFSLTIRATKASEMSTTAKIEENRITNQQLLYDIDRSEFEKFKIILDNLEYDRVGALDSIFDLYLYAKESVEAKSDLNKLKKISLIISYYIRKCSYSKNPTDCISDLNKNWDGRNLDIKTDIRIQHMMDIFFPKKEVSPLGIIELKFTESNFQRIDLSEKALHNIDFGGSCLQGASMFRSRFINCQFFTSQLQGANLSECEFINCNFSNANLCCANLCGAIFRDCELYEADMSCTLLTRATFDNTDMRKVKFDGSDILNENQIGLTISISNPNSRCNIQDATFNYCLLPKDHCCIPVDQRRNIKTTDNDGIKNRYSRILGYWKGLSAKNEQEKQILTGLYEKCIKYAVVDNYSHLGKDLLDEICEQMQTITNN